MFNLQIMWASRVNMTSRDPAVRCDDEIHAGAPGRSQQERQRGFAAVFDLEGEEIVGAGKIFERGMVHGRAHLVRSAFHCQAM